MTTFLQYVADDLLKRFGAEGLSRVAVVFPNKRASLFLNQALAQHEASTMWSPTYYTISDLFRHYGDMTVADNITAICLLHRAYCTCTKHNVSLDDFFGWGQLLLADFDDLDKNMADPQRVLTLVAQYKDLERTDYVSQQQWEHLQRFFHDVSTSQHEMQRNFTTMWNCLLGIYNEFRRLLAQHTSQGRPLCYEGQLYRSVAEKDITPLMHYDHYVFVGFNVLQKVEQQLFDKLNDTGKALFYWDYDDYFMLQEGDSVVENEAGRYLKQWQERYPNALNKDAGQIYDTFRSRQGKRLCYLSAPTEDLQARYVMQWLTEEVDGKPRYAYGNRTAIVMCDETLLQTIVRCIPQDAAKGGINITTGFPLQQTAIASLVSHLLTLQEDGYDARRKTYRLHHVATLLRHPYAQYILAPNCRMTPNALLHSLQQQHKYHLTDSDLPLCAFMQRQTADMQQQTAKGTERQASDTQRQASDTQRQSTDSNVMLLDWLLALVKSVGRRAHHDDISRESTFRMHTLLTQLRNLIAAPQPLLQVQRPTLVRLLSQLISATSVPFHGEPATGVQVMGILETRNLDFDHVLLLSCNEGNMPKGVDDASFLPHDIRAAYGLTTIDNKVAVYSYYFHSLLQRAHDVTITYNTSTDGMSTSAMSRFMTQLMVELHDRDDALSPVITQQRMKATQQPLHTVRRAVVKDETVMRRLDEMLDGYASGKPLSPSALNTYLRCPLRFFYNYVAHIKESDDVDDDEIDNIHFGLIFHTAAELTYRCLLPKERIEKKDLEPLIENGGDGRLQAMVDLAIKVELLHTIDSTDTAVELYRKDNRVTPPDLDGLQVINREVMIIYLRQLLQLDRNVAPLRILQHEFNVKGTASVCGRTIEYGGRVDRLDRIHLGTTDERLRVVDYKTGSGQIKFEGALPELFLTDNIDKHSDYALQALTYSLLVQFDDMEHNPQHEPVCPSLIFIQHAAADDYDPTLKLQCGDGAYQQSDSTSRQDDGGNTPQGDGTSTQSDGTSRQDNGGNAPQGNGTSTQSDGASRQDNGKPSAKAAPVTNAGLFKDDFRKQYESTLEHIFTKKTPSFEPTPFDKRCHTCPYANVCG